MIKLIGDILIDKLKGVIQRVLNRFRWMMMSGFIKEIKHRLLSKVIK